MNSLTAVIRAESIRSQRTFTRWMLLVVGLFGGLSILISHNNALSASTDWNGGVLAWLSIFPMAFALPIATLVGALAEQRDVAHRGGGTWWRSTSPHVTSTARLIVESFWILIALLVLVGLILVDAAFRNSMPAPWGRIATIVAVLWISMTGATAVGRVLHRLVGAMAVGLGPVVVLVWSIAGAVRAEAPSWWAEPWAWMAHAVLPGVGTHGNSVPLEDGSPIWEWSPIPGLLLAFGLTVVVSAASIVISRRRAGGDERAGFKRATARAEHLPTGARKSVAGAVEMIFPWKSVGSLTVSLLVGLVLVRLIFPASYAPRFFTLLAAPGFAAALGLLMWASVSAGWRGVMSRRAGVNIPLSMIAIAGLVALPVQAIAAAIAFIGTDQLFARPGSGGDGAETFGGVYALMVLPVVLFAIAVATYALAAITSVPIAIVVNTILAVWSLVVAGDALADSSLWFTSLWGWADIAATHAQRWLLIWLLAAGIGVFAVVAVRMRATKLA